MKAWFFAAAAAAALPATRGADDPLMAQTQALAAEVTAHAEAFDNLAELTTQIGPRLAASPNAEKAVQWAKAKLDAYGFDNVTLQPMNTPVWTRGDTEQATVNDNGKIIDLKVTALGGSVGTGATGVEAEVVEVQGLDEVDRLGAAVKDKIVFYNRPMDPTLPNTFEAYGGAIDQRSDGPSRAASHGAVATIVRSLTTLVDDDHPHTGVTGYRIDSPKIPAVAVSTHGAGELSRRLKANPHLKVHLALSAQDHGMGTSHNVYAEITGSERPNEVVLVGGHLDSWDLGVGAQDDGPGIVQSMEVLRAIKALGMRPKRTIRVVLFMTEEFGGYGARDYATDMKKKGVTHIAAIESDRGGFAPVGFSTDAGTAVATKLRGWARYLAPLNAGVITEGDSGTDVEPLNDGGTATIGYVPVSTHYFDVHHSSLDQLAAVSRDDLHAGAAAMAALAWLYAADGL